MVNSGLRIYYNLWAFDSNSTMCMKSNCMLLLAHIEVYCNYFPSVFVKIVHRLFVSSKVSGFDKTEAYRRHAR
jgi:hypothetical protein